MKRVLGEIVPTPKRDDIRIIRVFLWLPKTLANANGEWEERWFEWANIKQRFTTFFKSEALLEYDRGEWRNIGWHDE